MKTQSSHYAQAVFAFLIASLATFYIVQTVSDSYISKEALKISNSSPTTSVDNEEEFDQDVQAVMTTRVCGSPAVDGYAHVNPKCLRDSPTAQWWYSVQPDPERDLITHIERQADYDGLAVAWGIGNKKGSIEECAEACRNHKMNPNDLDGFGALPCNAFAWCGADVCFEPDAHTHHHGDCWLKFTEAPASPEVNMRGLVSVEQRRRHSTTAPKVVQWHAGVLLPRGVKLTNGTWSPRYDW